MKREVDRAEDVTTCDWGVGGRQFTVIMANVQVDRPLRNAIVCDAHSRDGRVRGTFLKLPRNYNALRATPRVEAKRWRCKVKVKVYTTCFSV